MWQKKYFLLVAVFTASFYKCNGCQMDGVNNWLLPVSQNVYDTHRGSFFSRSTTDITGISSVNYGEGLNSGPYVTVSYANSVFDITTNNAFPNYEENETVASMSFTVVFSCAGGSTSTLVFLLNIIDTNNNAPQFLPSDEYEFVIAPPVPPGFQITGCVNDITVRDIDLTTQRIDFEIENNPYFEIAYDASSSTVPKEFKAVLRTTTLIRTLSEDIQLRISATDVDQTGDPAITTFATIRIKGDTEFQLPEEPIFSQPFYLASYTEDHQINLQEPISLKQGYHEDISFLLDGEYVDNFELIISGNQVSINVTTPLSSEVLRTGQVVLVVNAEREFTSGASTTIIVQLPTAADLEFEQALYEGTIVDNALQLSPLVLSQGYEDGVSVTLLGEHSSFFTSTVQGNRITLTMSPLNTSIIDDNNFISLQVVASTNHSVATTIVTLDVIKDDNVTPAFERTIYTGAYDPSLGLTLGQIALVQGYDETVSFDLDGEHATYFELVREGPVVRVNVISSLPTQLFALQRILLTIQATKPRTVGANAVISIDLPPARELDFEASSYKGTLRDNELSLQTIVLSLGFDQNVTFDLSGDSQDSFTVTNVQNQITINLSTPLAESVISENNFLMLTLTASGEHALTASTTILLEIIKQDVTTPVFSQNIYHGTYLEDSIDVENITLVQGLDNSVTFALSGEHSSYFSINSTGDNLVLTLDSPIPEEIIFNEKVLLFSIIANKPLTVGADATISIKFPQELTEPTRMRFSQNTYIGSVENNTLTLENLILETGFANGTVFSLTGEYASSFTHTSVDNIVTISMVNIPAEVLEDNQFIVLELEAQRERAVSVSSSIIIEIIKEDRILPIFSEAYYRGVYSEDTGLQFENEIYLSQGYDETVTYGLEGAQATWFSLSQNGSYVTVNLNGTIPEEILDNNNQLLFTIVATKPDTINGVAVISIDLPKDLVILRFTRNSYVGSIDNGVLLAPTLTVLGGNSDTLQLNITGEYASYFRLSRVANDIEIELITALPIGAIDENVFLILDIEVSSPDAVSGYTTVIIELIREPVIQIVTPLFSHAYYSGEYSDQDGLLFEHSMQLIQGFDESVVFTLAGDDARWFELVNNGGNNLSLSVKDEGLQQIEDRSQLVFSIVADNSNSIGRAAIVITLSDLSISRPLRFSQNYYLGSIENDNLTISAITVEEGYSENINVSFTGDYVDYFQLTDQGGVFTLQLLTQLPVEVTDGNNVLILTLEVQTTSNRAATTIVVEIVKNDVTLSFDEDYYVSSFSATDGLQSEPITLIDGYDDSVSFSLEGEQSQWFGTVRADNTVTLTITTPIPIEVLSDNQQLIFVVAARRPGSEDARATVVVKLIDEPSTVLRFESNNYLGSIVSNNANIGPIVISEGYTQNVSLTLLGDLASYFNVSSEGANVTVTLRDEISEELVPENRIVLLELVASAPQAVPAYTTLVFEAVQETIDQLVFREAYYTGLYTEAESLIFEEPATLAEGYDENVQFTLEGDDSQWFRAVTAGNSVSIELNTTIPLEVLVNSEHLIFVLRADKLGSVTARTAVVISLVTETSDLTVLGFEKHNYLGTIENELITLEQITVNEGYTQNVTFHLDGELATFFTVTNEGANVSIGLRSIIPEDSIPENRIVLLELRASAPESISAYTTIVFIVIEEEFDELVFSETYYTGLYTETENLIFENAITLVEGYDDIVEFSLEGDATQWIGLNRTGNSVSLTLITPIPAEILANNQQLILVITASRIGRTSTKATIVISLVENTNVMILGFERNNYLGKLENNITVIEPITLTDGYSQNVSFTLLGELSAYFTQTSDGATVTIRLANFIPEEVMPSNRIIILELQASAPTTIPAFTTVVFEVVRDDLPAAVELVFNQTYYTGYYTEADSLVFETNIILTEGYNENVQFALEGGNSQWFGPVISGNSVTLALTSPIPPAVLANNQQLIFVIRAQHESVSAKATIVISLIDEYTEDMVLGFERVTYIGTIENNTTTLEPITLNEGYSENVSFTLHGDLSDYFSLLREGATVNIALQNTIPEESLPTNRIITLELQASLPPMIPAFATVVFEVVRDDLPAAVELVFNQTYYTGYYTEADSLVFETNIILTEGYNENVQFVLEGDNSQWFGPVISGNSVILALTSPIPPAVLANNQQLIFVIRAQHESVSARATIVISLIDEYTEDMVLGFERVTYLGTIENNTTNLEPITLNEGYSENVSFTLHGDLSNYFSLLREGATVNIVLQNTIPEESLPTNRIITLELQASLPPMIPAFATVVFEVVRDDLPAAVELVFNQTYYTGYYTEADSLVFETNIILTEGYNENVQFVLEGDNSQWFGPVISGNSVTLALTSPIPPAVLANNQQLIFVIRAQHESVSARATIVISLIDEYTEDMVLGFERVTYLGTIENNTTNLEPITLNEGYSENVSFTLHGDLSNYFSLLREGATVNIVLQNTIPEESLPTNRIITLELQASLPPMIPAFATVVFEVVRDDLPAAVKLVFNQTYYTGYYTEADSLVFETNIILTEGYNENVQFVLEGDNSQWFGPVISGNSVTLALTSPIPPAVLANNQQLIFVIRAQHESVSARATIVISLIDEYTEDMVLGFERVTYIGTIENNTTTLEPITLNEGYSENVSFTLHGDLSDYFSLLREGATVNIALQNTIPEESLPTNRVITLELQASLPPMIPAFATVVFEVVRDDLPAAVELVFNQAYYTGYYTEADSLVFETNIILTEGYNENVQFALEGDNSQWFGPVISGNSVTLALTSPIPPAVLANNQQLIFVIRAQHESVTARATIVISLIDEFTDDTVLGFERISYLGTIQNNTIIDLEPIVLNQGYSENVSFALHGDLSNYFRLLQESATVNIELLDAIPEESMPTNGIIVLELQASALPAMPAFTAIIFEVKLDEALPIAEQLIFSNTYYTGRYTDSDGLVFEDTMSLIQGFDENVVFTLEGDSSIWFSLVISDNSVLLKLETPIPPAVLINNRQIIFTIRAEKPNSLSSNATIVIITDEYTNDAVLGFNRINYFGTIDSDLAIIETAVLSEGYSENVNFTLYGDLANYFILRTNEAEINIELLSAIPEESIPANLIILLELQASAPQTMSAFASIIFEVLQKTVEKLIFSEAYYIGQYTETNGLILETPILLANGYDPSVEFALDGDNSNWFEITRSENMVILTLRTPIPQEVLENNQQLVFVITAQKIDSPTARAAIIISLDNGSETVPGVSFDRVLYEGLVRAGVVQHEPITISGYNGTDVTILGEYTALFTASSSEGIVTVRGVDTVTLATNVTFVPLELRAGGAGAVLLLDVIPSGSPDLPTVTFGSQSYVLRVEITHSGRVGQVLATADNGEAVTYSLVVDNAHLQQRLSIDNEGELHLSAPANSGVYSFQVVATTVFTQVTGTAPIHLTVDAITVCANDIVVPPLIILDRDEELEHRNLVVINGTEHEGCRYRLTNRWPIDQTWLYVDETGLHTTPIDREHESIAFMALSQVQVELILECDSDVATRTKRSAIEETTPRLGPYDYGDNKWTLTDTIQYNSRRSLVNLIVNDINDNSPIFVGKENEPIVFGYPVAELEERVLPRALAELKATDADIGVNAELVYWSSEDVLAVSPLTGSVHVRQNSQLENDSTLTVHATDLRGEGNIGSINITVKLLDTSHIAVVTVSDAFLDDEETILSQIISAVGYEVKVLRSTVISESTETETRNKRDVSTKGASLQLYVYGLIERQPVNVDQLTEDINSNVITTVSIASTISLEDHLESLEICDMPGRDTGLLVATIILSVLLFILIVAIAVWFYLTWRKKQNYQQFSDANSLASRNESLEQIPKVESLPKPRLNIEDLKRSERRLQEMLDAPMEEVTVQPTTSKEVEPIESKVTVPIPEPKPQPQTPMVIQSIDKLNDVDDSEDDDEFGERARSRRKSVVTFNENVEKIIHLEDNPDDDELPDYEVYKF